MTITQQFAALCAKLSTTHWKTLQALFAEVLRRLEASEWRSDMENAPRDGHYILCVDKDGYIGIRQFNESSDVSIYSHWMPLPAPPVIEPQ